MMVSRGLLLFFFVAAVGAQLRRGDKMPAEVLRGLAHTGQEIAFERDFGVGRGVVVWFYPQAGTAG